VAGLLAGCGAPEGREPNDFERVYTVLALEFEDPRFCFKISPLARTVAAFNPAGLQVFFERSQCFMFVARRTLNAGLCREVREAEHFWHSGAYFTAAICRAEVAAGNVFRASFGWPSSVPHEKILRAAGYTLDDVRRRLGERPPENAWFDFFHDFRRRGDGELQQRLIELPDFAATGP
jgi:hypothetical protein